MNTDRAKTGKALPLVNIPWKEVSKAMNCKYSEETLRGAYENRVFPKEYTKLAKLDFDENARTRTALRYAVKKLKRHPELTIHDLNLRRALNEYPVKDIKRRIWRRSVRAAGGGPASMKCNESTDATREEERKYVYQTLKVGMNHLMCEYHKDQDRRKRAEVRRVRNLPASAVKQLYEMDGEDDASEPEET
eukprot:GHVU01005771.1.p1 GENE.GHVU01005771.1~~GHVU01005771.1.p1  ORF type:complete len:191 (+),score=39.03 GHVU01005771.1:486-1058(+)